MAYTAGSFVALEQPTTAKWNQLWANDAYFYDAIQKTSGHVVLTPDANKLVKSQNALQQNTTNSYPANQVRQKGWGYIQGNGTDTITETITFPTAFSSAPTSIIATGTPTVATTTTPTAITDFNLGTKGTIVSISNISTTGFTVTLFSTNSTFANTFYFGYMWEAEGTLT